MPTSISELAGKSFDLIVIGAGINGTGIARDAAMRGLHVLLVDKGDIASGTTSWSSRLIHGGLRYLEHAEIGLVRESLRERERLLHIAPHLVKPLPLTLPIYKHHQRGPLLIRAGMIAYDVLSYDKSLPRHRMFSASGALTHEPGLNPEDLSGAARYYDAQVEFPERLSLENALDAVAHGAYLRTYTKAENLQFEAGVVRGVDLVDTLRGEGASVRTACVVNVAGPWVDAVLATSEHQASAKRLIGATKGSHIIVEPFPGAPKDALYIEASQDGRPYFIIPWNHLYLIGTTDVRFDGDPDNVHPSEEEIEYLLTETNIAIPGAGLNRNDVLYAYAGLRPLPYQTKGAESAITRRHVIHDHAPKFAGLISVIGGKLTTFRNLSEIVVNDVFRKLGRKAPASLTANEPLPGAGGNISRSEDRFFSSKPAWLDATSAAYLFRIYGARARNIVELAHSSPELRSVVHEKSGAIAAGIVFSVTEECAATLIDIIYRRTMIGYSADAGQGAIDAVSRILGNHCGWSEPKLASEREHYEQFLRESKAKSQD